VLSIRKNELQWLPPDAAKMKSMQQLIVTGFGSFCLFAREMMRFLFNLCCRQSFYISISCSPFEVEE
jgi:hypothetical protein